MNTKKKTSSVFLLLFMCWLVYSMSYLGKVNFTASKLSVMTHFGVLEDEVGLVGTFFFFSYAIGMLFNGIFCKKYNIKWVVFSALMISSIINFIIPLVSVENFWIIKFMWMVNGVVLSVLWPSLIRLLSETLPTNKMPSASRVMGTTVATGTFIIYGLSALFSHLQVFQLAFYVPAIVGPTVGILWLITYKKATVKQEDLEQEFKADAIKQVRTKSKLSTNILIIICCLALFAVITNLLKDGLTSWVPKILKDSFELPDSISILMALGIPAMGIVANFITVWLAGKAKNLIFLEGCFFMVAGAMVVAIILLLSTDQVVITFACLMFVSLVASGSNNIITSIFPLYMKGKVNSGLIAGVLNSFCYLGSTISDYGLGAVKVATNSWNAVFYVLLGASAIVVVVSIVYTVVNAIVQKKKRIVIE